MEIRNDRNRKQNETLLEMEMELKMIIETVNLYLKPFTELDTVVR